MENMQDRKELNQREQEQVSGGLSYKCGYYCYNVNCSKYDIVVSPTIDNKCSVCGSSLVYGNPPEIIDV